MSAKHNAYMKKVDEPARAALATARTAGREMFIRASCGLPDGVRYSPEAKQNALEGNRKAILLELQRIGAACVKATHPTEISAKINKDQAKEICALDATSTVREGPGLYGYRQGNSLDLTR